ncbi:AAA family ATPase [Haliangium sp.]|uniref:AAA family ATPase n=1 Tax=Haliangium sp. TaxID=2663208 RepID=UPI003D0ACFA8
MLPSLHIQGFRCFRDLTIPHLGRVNLVVGKNNVGKTTVLEALRVHAARGDAPIELYEILNARGDVVRDKRGQQRQLDWMRLFHGGGKDSTPRLSIGPLEEADQTFCAEMRMNESVVHYKFGIDDRFPSDPLFSLVNAGPPSPWPHALEPLRCRFMATSGLDPDESARIWDGIVLTDLEEVCLRALRIVEPDIQRIALVEVPGSAGREVERAPYVSLASGDRPEPLHSLGEGMNRLYDLTLGMIDARGGRLLVDEIENGLHYSIHGDMWRYVFQVATELDVQVFATTHSWDCIQAFQAAASEHAEEGVLIRLERRDGDVRAFLFDEDELSVVAEQAIEVR